MRRASVLAALVVCALLACAEARPAPGRSLLQRFPTVYGNNQMQAQRAAAAITRDQIRWAADNPGFGTTRAATATGQVTSTLAAVNPCALSWGPNCWGYWNGRRRF